MHKSMAACLQLVHLNTVQVNHNQTLTCAPLRAFDFFSWFVVICRIWPPDSDTVVKVPQKSLKPLSINLQPEIESARQIIPQIRPILLLGISGSLGI